MTMTFDQYWQICDAFDAMAKAGTYAPTAAVLRKETAAGIGVDDHLGILRYLMWIEETGTETEENREDRKALRDVINRNLTITD